jgi:phage gpG-like protein
MAFPKNLDSLSKEMIDAMLKETRRTATEIAAQMQQATVLTKAMAREMEKAVMEDFPFETKVHPDWRPKRPGHKGDTIHIGHPPILSLRLNVSKPNTKP